MTTLPQTMPIRVPRPMQAGPMVASAGGPLGGYGGAPASPAGLTAADVLRVVRQNIWLIAIAVVAGGVCGFFVNSYLLKNYPKYKTVGLIVNRGANELPEPGGKDVSLRPEEIALLQETNARTMMHESLFMEAIDRSDSKIRQTAWFKSFESENDPMAARKKNLRDNFAALPLSRSRHIQVEMTTSVPEDAKVIVEELTDVFIARVRKEQKDADTRQIDLMTKERNLLQNDLDQDINVQLRAKEQEFGASSVEVASQWNGKRMQLDGLLTKSMEISQTEAGIQSQIDSLDVSQKDGTIAAEVQAALGRDNRYLAMKQQIDQMDIVIGQNTGKLLPSSDQMVSFMTLRKLYQQKLDEIREELKADFTNTFKATLQNQKVAILKNKEVIDQSVAKLGAELGRLNETMTQYRVLQQREQRIREKVNAFDSDIRRVREFRLAVPWSQVEWASKPQVPDTASFPRLLYTMPIAVMLALALSLGLAFLREMTDTTVRSPRDIAKVGQINLLGLIPHVADDPQASGARLPVAIMDAPNSHIAEQFRQIRTRLQYAHSLDTTRSILVTSPSANDGKTTVACNLAASLALNGRKILLVDANFRRPQLNAAFNLPNDVGFGEVLTDLDRLAEVAKPTDVPNLSVLTTGGRPANPTELLESQFFIDFIERALDEYDHVIFDSGPMLMVSESVAMAPRVDGVMTVVRARGNSRGLLTRMRDELRRVKAEHVGVVLNAVRSQGGGYYGRNIKSYYAYENA